MASDYYMKIDGVTGSSQATGAEGWIEIYSFSFGASAQATTSGSGYAETAGKPNFSELSFSKHVDASTPTFFGNLTVGQRIKGNIDLVGRKMIDGSPQTFYTITLTNALVSGYQISGASGSDTVPTESISLRFESIQTGFADEVGLALQAPVLKGINLATLKPF